MIQNFNTNQHFQKSGATALVSVSHAQQLGLRVPNAAGQQVTIQRAVSPLVAQQISGANQSGFIHCLSNAAVISQQLAQTSPGVGQLQTTQAMGGNLRATSPIGTATIVGPASHIGTATLVAGQPVSIHPRQPVAFISGTPPTGMTLTVTSVSPGPAALQTSASSANTQVTLSSPQVIWPGSTLSQGQVIRTGIPVVLPRGALTFTGRPQIIQSSNIPRIIQKPMVSLSASCGGQVTVQVPQVVSPVIKTSVSLPSASLNIRYLNKLFSPPCFLSHAEKPLDDVAAAPFAETALSVHLPGEADGDTITRRLSLLSICSAV